MELYPFIFNNMKIVSVCISLNDSIYFCETWSDDMQRTVTSCTLFTELSPFVILLQKSCQIFKFNSVLDILMKLMMGSGREVG